MFALITGGATGKECQDHSVHCRLWMEAGECTENVDYMSLFCKKSCGLCMDTEAGEAEAFCSSFLPPALPVSRTCVCVKRK